MRRKHLIAFAVILALSRTLALAADIDTSRCSVTIRVYKSGLFSGFAHNHIIKAPIASGSLDTGQRSISLTFNVADMKVADPEGSESEHQEIEATMKGPKVLDGGRFPSIAFHSTQVDQDDSQHYHVRGELKLHGQTRDIAFPVVLTGGLYTGAVTLKQTDFGITPVKIAGGTVRVKDEIEISFEIAPR